jgi:hypothetical protein
MRFAVSEAFGYRSKYHPQPDSLASPQNDPDLLASPLSPDTAGRLLSILEEESTEKET